MAVLEVAQGGAKGNTLNTMNNENINNMQLLDEPIAYNPEAETSGITKIPDGTYLMELSLGKFGIQVKKSAKGDIYLDTHVQGKIVDPGGRYDNFRASGFITSNAFDDGTSPIQQFLKRAGDTNPYATARELLAAVETNLNGVPQIYTKLRWEAKGKDNNGKWQRAKNMKVFPLRPDGSHDPFIELPGVDEPCEARETIYAFAAAPAAAGA